MIHKAIRDVEQPDRPQRGWCKKNILGCVYDNVPPTIARFPTASLLPGRLQTLVRGFALDRIITVGYYILDLSLNR